MQSIFNSFDPAFTPFTRWSGKNFFYGPSGTDARVKGGARDVDLLGPVSYRQRLPGVSQPNRIRALPLILGLFLHGGPPAIVRFIVTVVINALNRMFIGGRFTHIGQEIQEVVPPITDLDATPSVVRILGGALNQAATSQRAPRAIGSSSDITMSRPFSWFHGAALYPISHHSASTGIRI